MRTEFIQSRTVRKVQSLVTIRPDTCTCEAYKFNGNDCKHINAVKNILREEEQRREERHMAIAVYKTEDLMILD
ncbi:MAG: SWIM zinc finger family protein [Candidatus Nitrosocaldaceae archaeon]